MSGPGERPLRVLMTADAIGGVFTYSLTLAGALGAHGVDVHLATMGRPLSPGQRAAAARIPSLVLHESEYQLEWMDEPWEEVERAGAWLVDLAAKVRADVVHVNGYAHAALPFEAPAVLVAHSCVLSWWAAVLGERAPARYDRYAIEVMRGLEAAAAVAAPTSAMLAAIEEHYGAVPNARVIVNACDPRAFRIAAKEPFVLAAGRVWDAAKNVAALEAVAAELPWPVLVAGDDVDPDGRRRAPRGVRALGLQGPDAMADLFSRAAIYAHPARYEPFGLSALEAAMSGCALVLGDLPSLREVWGDAAVFVAPDDHGALREALTWLAVDVERRAGLAARARERALAHSPERMAVAYLELYRDARAARGSPGFGDLRPSSRDGVADGAALR